MASLLRPDDGPSSTPFDAAVRPGAPTPRSLSYGTRREAPPAFDPREYRVVESISCSFRHILSSLEASTVSIHRRSSTSLNTSASRVLSDFHRIRGSALRCLLTALDLDRFAVQKARRHIGLLYEDQRFSDAEEAKKATAAFPSLLSLLHCHLEKNGVEEWDRWDRREVNSELEQSLDSYLPLSSAEASALSTSSSPSFPVSNLLPSLLDPRDGRFQVGLDEEEEEQERNRRRRKPKRMNDSATDDVNSEAATSTEVALRAKERRVREAQKAKQRRQQSQQQKTAVTAADEEVQAIMNRHTNGSTTSLISDRQSEDKEEREVGQQRHHDELSSQVLLRLPRILFSNSPMSSPFSPPVDVEGAAENGHSSPSSVRMSSVLMATSPIMNGSSGPLPKTSSPSPAPAPAPATSAPAPPLAQTSTSAPKLSNTAPAASSLNEQNRVIPDTSISKQMMSSLTSSVSPLPVQSSAFHPPSSHKPTLTPSRPARERRKAPRYGDESDDEVFFSPPTRTPSKPRKQLTDTPHTNGHLLHTPPNSSSVEGREEQDNGVETEEYDPSMEEDVHEIERYLAYRYRAYPPFHPKASEHYRMYLVKWKGWTELWWIMEEDLVSVDPKLLQALPEWEDWRALNPNLQVKEEQRWEDPKDSQPRKRPIRRRSRQGAVKHRRT